ncbi:protein dispatched homolog 1 isoform X2 [Patella vulgata]|uniref:protein dispatched homolog 1 isoform X2 n=1 Tax=Patella vulgata TaxID=6465 RepID=UPI00217F7213|nr:protein dispatched homolog 1 isoform X2 [Patella vulgata]
MSYARILAHYPCIVLVVVLVVAVTCLVVSITVGEQPDFSDPLAGFEPRQTEIGARMVAYENLVKNNDENVNLLPYVKMYKENLIERIRNKSKERKRQKEKKKKRKKLRLSSKASKNSSKLEYDSDEKFFCGIPDKAYARLVFGSADGSSLYSAKNLHNLCLMESSWLHKRKDYRSNCIKAMSHNCCRSWSLGNYVALLSNKSGCMEVTEDDLSQVLNTLEMCAPFYGNYSLGPNCHFSPDAWFYSYDHPLDHCPGIPHQCTQYNAVYHILHYLTDSSFSKQLTKNNKLSLKYTITFLPVAGSSSSIDLYKYIESLPRQYKTVEIVGAEFGIKHILFEEYLISDTKWLSAAGAVIFIFMWLYSSSIFITCMTFLAMFGSLEVAYFLYMFVFEIKFFPYMNMVTVIIMIGIGADDMFIYCKVWHLSKSEKNNGTLEKIVSDTLRHATLSMLVTSLTTSAAFYSNYISDITAIQCFSIYAGTAVFCNFVLMITWIPASIMAYKKWCNFCVCHSPDIYSGNKNVGYYLCKIPYKLYYLITDWSRIFFEKILPCFVIRFRYLWLFIYGSLGICGVLVIFYYPRLKLPSSKKFQVFSSNHLLEKYDFELGEVFGFEKTENTNDIPLLPITVIWGIHPIDNGDRLDPSKKGSLVFDSAFDLTTENAQKWILEFCQRLRRSDFYLKSPGIQLTNCFLENFVYEYMKQPCRVETTDNTPCCNETKFPFSRAVFSHCLSRYIVALQKTPGVIYSAYSPGPRFSNGQISAFFIEFLSNEPYSQSYEKMSSFYQRINQWVTEEMVQAPAEMRNGWLISDLAFYDLQKSLATGTPLAMGVSLAVAAVVAFFTTLNVLITLYAILCITCIIAVTIATLVLLGWELNILESVVITVAIGMSIDFTLHYGVAYRLSPDLDREMRVACSVGRMGSAVAMAALTTFLAGSLMMPSTVLAYNKFGIFLMLIITIGWVYSTFFFQSLLRTLGPQGGFGQFHWPSSDCCSPSRRKHVDKTVYAFSESTLSSSSTSYPNHTISEIHELEPLTEVYEPQSHSRPHSHARIRQKTVYADLSTRYPLEAEVIVPKRETYVKFESGVKDQSEGQSDMTSDIEHERINPEKKDEVVKEPKTMVLESDVIIQNGAEV